MAIVSTKNIDGSIDVDIVYDQMVDIMRLYPSREWTTRELFNLTDAKLRYSDYATASASIHSWFRDHGKRRNIEKVGRGRFKFVKREIL